MNNPPAEKHAVALRIAWSWTALAILAEAIFPWPRNLISHHSSVQLTSGAEPFRQIGLELNPRGSKNYLKVK